MDGANAELKEATFFAALKMHSSFILPILGYLIPGGVYGHGGQLC